jgi:hypothetical protein
MLSGNFGLNTLGRLTAVLLVVAFPKGVIAQDFLDLRVPEFEVTRATMEDALEKLNAWGIRVCLEKVPLEADEEDVRFSVSLRDASVREILDALVKADKRYTWRRYKGYLPSVSTRTDLINVLPIDADKDPEYLTNIRAKKVIIKSPPISPEGAIGYISYFVPEIVRKLYPGAIAGSILGDGGEKVKVRVNFEFEDMTVREILNEIALRTVGRGWVYEVVKGPKPEHRWYVLGWRPRRGNGARDRKGDGL